MRKKLSLFLAAVILASSFAAVSATAVEVKKPAKVKQTSATQTSVTVKWSKISKYAKYELKLSNGKNGKRQYKNIAKNKYKIKNLKPGKKYAIKVRAKIGKNYGAWSNVFKIVTAPKIAYKWTKGHLKVNWQNVKFATSYNIKLRLNYNKKKYCRITNLKTTTYTFTTKKLSGLSLNKVYDILVLPYQNDTKLFSGKITTRDIEITGHRGRMDIAPENTLISFKEAYKSGYDSFEADYWETKSGDLIISHDRILSACGSTADVRTLTAADIKKYPIIKGKNVKKYSTQYLPTVEQAIKAASTYKMKIYLHTKDSNTSDKAFKKIAGYIKKYKMQGKATVFSGTASTFERIVKNKLRAGFLTLPNNINDVKNSLKYAQSKKAKVVIFRYGADCINADILKLAHSYKLKMGCYNINDESTASDFANMKGDFLITNKYYFH